MIIDHSNATSNDMVTETCSLRENCMDILCVRCGWEAHLDPSSAPWPVFVNHIRTSATQHNIIHYRHEALLEKE